MSLLPRSLKIMTSAPQLPENKYPFSPDPQNPWGPMRGSRIFRQGVQVNLTKKALTTFFKVPEGVQDFQGGGGPTFSRGGGGSNCLFPIETHITFDFPGGGVRTPCPPLWIRTWAPSLVLPVTWILSGSGSSRLMDARMGR